MQHCSGVAFVAISVEQEQQGERVANSPEIHLDCSDDVPEQSTESGAHSGDYCWIWPLAL
jgi:hypothetical protein